MYFTGKITSLLYQMWTALLVS